MGKIRTRTIGLEEVEEKQKKKQKEKAKEKKSKGVVTSIDDSQKLEETKAKLDDHTEAQNLKPKTKRAKVKVRGKKYQHAKKIIDTSKSYSLTEALKLLKKIKFSKFDESVELHLNVLDTGLKGEVQMPHSIGKITRVRVVDDKSLEDIQAGKIDFDILVAHPSFMPKLSRLAKILGPKGLMPSLKNGTLSSKPEEVVKKFTSGTLRWKSETKFPLIHLVVGKVSFEEKNLTDNIKVLVKSIGKNNIQEAFIATTMSPSVKLNITEF